MSSVDPVLENVRLALASGADPAMVLCVALASMSPATMEDAFDELEKRKVTLLELVRQGPGDQERRPADLEPEITADPELGRMRPDLQDHEVRGQLLFGDILGRKSFFQVAALAIGGLDVSPSVGEFLDHSGVLTQLLDPRIWGLAVSRRIGARGGGLAHALVAGLACLCTPKMTGQPVGAFMRFLDEIEANRSKGVSLETFLETTRAEGRRIAGIGRPVVGPDERVPEIRKLAARYGLDAGPSWNLAQRIDSYFDTHAGVSINSAGLQGAILRDIGFSPSAASALCMIYFVLPLLANAVFLQDRTQ